MLEPNLIVYVDTVASKHTNNVTKICYIANSYLSTDSSPIVNHPFLQLVLL